MRSGDKSIKVWVQAGHSFTHLASTCIRSSSELLKLWFIPVENIQY